MYGPTEAARLSVKDTMMPESLLRPLEDKESARLFAIAARTGIIALIEGISTPISRAYIVALALGSYVGLNPRSSVNRKL